MFFTALCMYAVYLLFHSSISRIAVPLFFIMQELVMMPFLQLIMERYGTEERGQTFLLDLVFSWDLFMKDIEYN